MDKKVWLIRHGESTANAGAVTKNHITIPLSTTGQEQAKRVSLLIPESPALIITSPFTRTLLTAKPTLERFPWAIHEVWNVQEFTHLAVEKYADTPYLEIKKKQHEYWERLDPDYIDGDSAESFTMLLSRAKAAIDHLNRLPSGLVVMFTHAQFIRALRVLKENQNPNPQELIKTFMSLPRVDNCEITKWE